MGVFQKWLTADNWRYDDCCASRLPIQWARLGEGQISLVLMVAILAKSDANRPSEFVTDVCDKKWSRA